MSQKAPNSNKSAAVFLASLFVISIISFLIGKFSSIDFFNPNEFNSFYLFLGFFSGIIITYAFANFVLKERYRERLFSDAITDPHSGLYTRHYMNEVVPRYIGLHDRDPQSGFAMSIVELIEDEHNKSLSGKSFMKQAMSALATIVMEKIRETDVAVQYSDNQIAIFSTCENDQQAMMALKRITDEVAQHPVNIDESSISLELKSYQAVHESDETLSQLLTRAEKMLTDVNA